MANTPCDHPVLGNRSLSAVGLALALLLASALPGCQTEPADQVPLTQLYTPSFGPPPPREPALVSLRKLYERLPELEAISARPALLPNQSGVLWLSLVITLVVAFDFANLWSPRNLDLLLMQAVGWCFFDILIFLERLNDPTSYNLMDWVFGVIVGLTVTLLVRALRRVSRPAPIPWQPGLARRALAAVAITLVALDVGMALYAPPDDAGYFINIGAQRLRERGRWPYGDPLLTGTPAAAYGPVLYAAHVPFQLLLAPEPINATSPARPGSETGTAYYLPPLLATKLCTIAFHLVGVAALYVAARRLAGVSAAWALVALYSGSAFVLGAGGADYSIGGITFASHIGPAAVTLLAFALLPSPAWSGAALATSVGVLFYPVFFVPAWLGFYSRSRRQLGRFVVGFAVAAMVIGGSVLLRSEAAGGRSLIGTIVFDTIGHQESPAAYGSSPFGFWGQRGGVRGWLMAPLVGGQSLTRPAVLGFLAFAATTFFLSRGRSTAQLALVIAAVAMGAQLWKIHATATYVTWYYPFLLIGFLCGKPEPAETPHA